MDVFLDAMMFHLEVLCLSNIPLEAIQTPYSDSHSFINSSTMRVTIDLKQLVSGCLCSIDNMLLEISASNKVLCSLYQVPSNTAPARCSMPIG